MAFHGRARRSLKIASAAASLWGLLASASVVSATPTAAATPVARHEAKAAQPACNLGTPGHPVSHVIYLTFDNVHLTRDNPNVPSDLEQMPHLLSYLEQYGVVLGKNHTALIAHTGGNLVTAATGVYPDRHGLNVSNAYGYFRPDGSVGFTGSFSYWTDPAPTGVPQMIAENGKTAPAPWVPYTRAGCSVGAVASANIVLENTKNDITTVFGPGSPEASEAASNPTKAQADFVGIAVHCAKDAAACQSPDAKPDLLPDEPGGYNGYKALFGNKYVAPAITSDGVVRDLSGSPITDEKGNQGFPGFDGMSATNSLGYVASMLEHGIPVVYSYMSDLHDDHQNRRAFGPGEAGYVQALKQYDQAFDTFFKRLAASGITPANTALVAVGDEGDHFVGARADGCDGVNVPCVYGPGQVGEVNTNYAGLLATQQGVTTPFSVHSDSAPTVYVAGNPKETDPAVRHLERATSKLTAPDPFAAGGKVQVTNWLAGPTEMGLLHMVTADPARTPTFTLFANPDLYLYAGDPNCNKPCTEVNPGFAWNHGDVSPDINTTWAAIAGPGVQARGVDNSTWADHTDIRPTLLALLGLHDSYLPDGRVLAELLAPTVAPAMHDPGTLQLARRYKQLTAPVGAFDLATLEIATEGLRSDGPGDGGYVRAEAILNALTAPRAGVIDSAKQVLAAAALGTPVPPGQAANLGWRAYALTAVAKAIAGS